MKNPGYSAYLSTDIRIIVDTLKKGAPPGRICQTCLVRALPLCLCYISFCSSSRLFDVVIHLFRLFFSLQ